MAKMRKRCGVYNLTTGLRDSGFFMCFPLHHPMDILNPMGPMTAMTSPGFHTWVQATLAMVDSLLAAG